VVVAFAVAAALSVMWGSYYLYLIIPAVPFFACTYFTDTGVVRINTDSREKPFLVWLLLIIFIAILLRIGAGI